MRTKGEKQPIRFTNVRDHAAKKPGSGLPHGWIEGNPVISRNGSAVEAQLRENQTQEPMSSPAAAGWRACSLPFYHGSHVTFVQAAPIPPMGVVRLMRTDVG